METAKHYTGLTDAQVSESRLKNGKNVFTPPQEDSFWDQMKETCSHWISLSMGGLLLVTIIVAFLLNNSMGEAIWIMPLIVFIASILITIVGFFGGFGDPLFKILITAFVLSMGISIYEYEWNNAGFSTFFEPIGIIFALILATSIAYFLEKRNKKTFESLMSDNDRTLVKTIRNSCICQIPREDIVVGDIIMLETGEEIPADCKLLDSLNLIVDESSLTGELQANKTTNPSNFDQNATYQSDLIMKGTNVIEGYCTAEVLKVGDYTESGKVFRSLTGDEEESVKVGWLLKDKNSNQIINKFKTEDEANDALEEYLEKHDDADVVVEQPLIDRMRVRKGSETPLSKTLNKLADWITNTSYVLAILIVICRIAWYLFSYDINFSSTEYWIGFVSFLLSTIMIAVTLIVVAVPEGLPMSVTLSLAFSMKKLMESETVPLTLHSCETIGAASVICTDKTGTLTMNQMRVAESKLEKLDMKLISEMISVNSTANLDYADVDKTKVIGNPTEGALLLWLKEKGENYLTIRESYNIIDRLPFSTENKYMATVVQSEFLQKKVVFVKGAPEILMSISSLADEKRQEYEDELLNYQKGAYRTLALGYQVLEDGEQIFSEGKLKTDKLTFAGIFAIHDKIREGVKESVKECMEAGIAVKIVTGDNPRTAIEIGKIIGLWKEDDGEKNIITGTELSSLSDKELEERVMDLKIIARARPMDKKRWFFCNLVEEASLYLYRFLYKEVYETLSKMALPDCAKY